MPYDSESSTRTVKQIVDSDGKPFEATLTHNVWVGHDKVFSKARDGNKITPFVTGEEYFKDVVDAMLAATSEICILGWQVNWDALLAPKLRLYDVLLAAAKKKVKIYVMPWNDTKPILTYDAQAKTVLESINSHPDVDSEQVQVILSDAMASKNGAYFSHHQKQVVIDRRIAYVGGIDLAYGRFDDAKYDLVANAEGREVLNRYNPCVPSILELNAKKLVDPELMTGAWDSNVNEDSELKKIASGGWQVPYAPPDRKRNIIGNSINNHQRFDYAGVATPITLDALRQPRMPWQDVHSRIEGPSVSDLLRNFVVRWNASGGEKLRLPKAPSEYEKVGNVQIQVLRSAPAAMRAKEASANPGAGKSSPGTEDDIHRAMEQLIQKSSKFIYIESQFFVSAFGNEADTETEDLSPAAQFISKSGGGDQEATAQTAAKLSADSKIRVWQRRVDIAPAITPPTNRICAALVKRIEDAILDAAGPHYHVYITIPVHPEGSVFSNASIAVQVYWTMQTISFGSKSLLNGIRRALKAKALRDSGDKNYRRVIDNLANTEYEDIPVEACFEYVTLLNLRNWAKIGSDKDPRYVTEQIYVHTKLMIVDDMYVLLGSANINDRSLLGERDSEIAVLVMDGDASRADTCGKGSQRPIRAYAHDLRKRVWSKLFGIAGGVRPAKHLANAIEQPGIPDSWRTIQKQAEKNAALYEAAFPFIPRNWSASAADEGRRKPASIVPNWDSKAKNPHPKTPSGYPSSRLPSEADFWKTAQHVPKGIAGLGQVKGFITALPVYWTQGEMNRFSYPSALVASRGDDGTGGNQHDPIESDNAVQVAMTQSETVDKA